MLAKYFFRLTAGFIYLKKFFLSGTKLFNMPKIPYRAKHYANVLNIEQPVTFDPYRKRVHHTATKEAGIAAMLQKLMIHDDYENALKLYKILLQSSRYHIANMWEMGVELIGTVEPKLLTDFLQGVFLSAPNKLVSYLI